MTFDDDLDSGRRMDQDFSKEDYRFRAKIISSEYKKKISDLIDQYDFSKQCKIQLVNMVNVLFDPNAMLARNESVDQRVLNAEISMNMAIVAYDESDVQNPGLLTISNAIIDAFRDFVSRSVGGRMGDRILIHEAESHQRYSGLPQEGSSQQEGRRGFKLPWKGE